jgi:hypothetical protein
VSRKPLNEQLGALKSTLAQRAQEESARREREAEAARREQAHREQFARAVGPVNRLPDKRLAVRTPADIEPIPRQRIADEAQALASSLSDDLDVTTLLDTDADLAFRREGIGV